MDMFDPNIALPENLTFIDDTVLPQINPEGNRRDWGTGITQKKFRVGSPTFFDNGINIPGNFILQILRKFILHREMRNFANTTK